jgi:endothelin-converting enzyme/putative endopeptidase
MVTPEQRFFISWTTVWRTKSRDEAIKTSKNGSILRNVPLCSSTKCRCFYQAFDIKGDGMFIEPDKRVKIW